MKNKASVKPTVLFVFGTRPEAIKMAPVIELARKNPGKCRAVVCVTGQHRYLLDQALSEFRIKPDIDLDLMRPDQSLYDVVTGVSQGLRDVYRKIKPAVVLLQGDTSTVFAAGLAAYYENIGVGHIEAGLRSHDIRNPFPEEVNRRFVTLVAKYNFCPTQAAKVNLLAESVDPRKIFVTGNTVIDALLETLKRVRQHRPQPKDIDPEFLSRPYVLITGHRRENFGAGMKNICMTIKSLARKFKQMRWVWVAHLNPNVRSTVFTVLQGLPNVKLVEPLSYGEFVYLMDNALFIISDSGGVQEEAPTLQKKVLVTRICTERPEAVSAGVSVMVGSDPGRILKEVDKVLKTGAPKDAGNPFGDGAAAQRIMDVITTGNCRQFQAGV